jgi:hypothetical protein
MNSAYNFNLYIKAHFQVALSDFYIHVCILLHSLPTESRQNISDPEDMHTFIDTPWMNVKTSLNVIPQTRHVTESMSVL